MKRFSDQRYYTFGNVCTDNLFWAFKHNKHIDLSYLAVGVESRSARFFHLDSRVFKSPVILELV